MQQNNKEYNIETYNCTTFAVEALEYAGIGGNFMPIREHDWTLPNDIKKAEGEVLLKYGNLDNIRVIENKTYFND